MRGRVSQVSYPGGIYRYAVEVGTQRFMVDDPRRIEVGESVGISLPAAAKTAATPVESNFDSLITYFLL